MRMKVCFLEERKKKKKIENRVKKKWETLLKNY